MIIPYFSSQKCEYPDDHGISQGTPWSKGSHFGRGGGWIKPMGNPMGNPQMEVFISVLIYPKRKNIQLIWIWLLKQCHLSGWLWACPSVWQLFYVFACVRACFSNKKLFSCGILQIVLVPICSYRGRAGEGLIKVGHMPKTQLSSCCQ